jgi:hypothetical protein
MRLDAKYISNSFHYSDVIMIKLNTATENIAGFHTDTLETQTCSLGRCLLV